MNKWEELCRLLQPLLGRDVPEAVFQDSFVLHLKGIFDWDKASIEEQRRIKKFSTPKFMDIVLSGTDFGIVIEMKRPCDRRNDSNVGQLSDYLSYIDDDKYKYGLLVGEEVTVIYYDKATSKKPVEVITFGFDSNDQDGIALGEILDKSVCSDVTLKKYIDEILLQEEREKRWEKLKNELLADNSKLAKEWIKLGYKGEYTGEDFDKVFEDIEIKVKNNGGDVVPFPPRPLSPGKTEIILLPNGEKFRENILRVKRARRTIVYADGNREENVWYANNMKEESTIKGNIQSSNIWRKRKEKKIVQLIFEVVDEI